MLLEDSNMTTNREQRRPLASFAAEYEVGDEIGSGKFAIVKQCRRRETNEDVAAKFIRKSRSSRFGQKAEDIELEIAILSQAQNHANIINLLDVFEDATQCILVFELMKGGELEDYIGECGRIEENEARNFLRQILSALTHLHQLSIVHLDLKPENILLMSDNSNHIKLIDFGISRKFSQGADIKGVYGTPEFIAPEILNYEPISFATDLWSVGCIAFTLLYGSSPFTCESKQDTFARITACDYEFDTSIATISDDARDFIERLLVKNLRKRMNAEEALNHHWIRGDSSAVATLTDSIELRETCVDDVDDEELDTKHQDDGCYGSERNWRHIWRRAIRIVILHNRHRRRKLMKSPLHRRTSGGGGVVVVVGGGVGGVIDVGSGRNSTGCSTTASSSRTPSPLSYHNSIISTRRCMSESSSSQSFPHDQDFEKSIASLKDENFLLAALFGAIEEGNLLSIQELFENSSVDPNQCNKHGESLLHYCAGLGQLEIFRYLVEIGADLTVVDDQDDTAVHWASRQNQPQIIRYVYDQTASIESINKNLETPLHVAARYGHVEAVEQLCKCGANINATDEHGETAILIAVWHGFPKIVHILGEIGANTDARNKEDETALHVASARGHPECVRCLLDAGANPNLRNKNSFTPLHLALKRQHCQVALLLLKAGANYELADCVGDRAIHYAARYNLVPICQWLCQDPDQGPGASRCQVNVPNKHVLYPLHIAAKSGHIEIVRALCLAGSIVDARDADSMIPQICAIAQSHNDIADLLTRLRNERQKDEFIQQLNPTPGTPLARLKLRIFGHCASGKSTLIESLKCGYFSSWFRRSKYLSTSTSHLPRSPTSPQSSKLLQTQLSEQLSIISNGATVGACTSLDNCQPPGSYENPTRGVESQHAFISGVGELAIWEFSGSPVYYQLYDHFLTDSSTCLNAIVFRLSDPPEVQLESILFWLRFIQSRQILAEPLLFGGRCVNHCRVVLVATHADLVQTIHGSLEAATSALKTNLLSKVLDNFRATFDIHPEVFTMDASVAGSAGMKNFKAHLSQVRTTILSSPEVPNSTRFLDSALTFLNLFRKVAVNFPVLPVDQFRDMIRSQINPLVSDEHFRDLISQLVIMGEICYLADEIIILSPNWLTCDIVGALLAMKCNPQSFLDLTQTSSSFLDSPVPNSRLNGMYSIDEFQDLFQDVDALDLLQLLESLRLCAQNDKSGDIEYEFPCFIVSGDIEQVLEQFQFRDHCVYHGVLYHREVTGSNSGTKISGPILSSIFVRIQTELRSQLRGHGTFHIDDLHNCHKFSHLTIEEHQLMMLLSVDTAADTIEARFCGAHESSREVFFFAQDILHIIESTIELVTPGLQVQRSFFSPESLKNQRENLAMYSSSSIMRSLLTAPTKFTSNQLLKRKIKSDDGLVEERLHEILTFGISNLNELGTPLPGGGSIDPLLASELHSSNLTLLTKQRLCQLLDPPEEIGRDWCMFGILLGMTDKLPKLDPNSPTTGNQATSSPTGRVIEECVRNVHCTIRIMFEKLTELNRFDAAEVILQTAPLLKVHPLTSLPEEGTVYNDEGSHTSLGVGTLSHTSSSNLSR